MQQQKDDDKKKLKQTHIIFRHGDRAPKHNYYHIDNNTSDISIEETREEGFARSPNRTDEATSETLFWKLQMPSARILQQLNAVAPISNSSMEKLGGSKSYPYQCLTMLGVTTSIQLGEQLRRRYQSLLDSPTLANSTLIQARATYYTRCVQTCQSFLVGFLNLNNNNNNISQPSLSSGVSIFVEDPSKIDNLTIPQIGSLCKLKFPGAYNIYKEYKKSRVKRIRSSSSTFSPLFNYYKKSLNNDKNAGNMIMGTFDFLQSHDNHNFKQPESLSSCIPQFISLVSKNYWNFFHATSHRISAPLIETIIQDMQKSNTEPLNNAKIYLYSAHDSSVMGVTSGVYRIFDAEEIFNVRDWPAYNSYVSLELWCDTDDEKNLYIRCVFNNDESKFLPLERFITLWEQQKKMPLIIGDINEF